MPSRPLPPNRNKPDACRNCSLFERGHSFVPPDGPLNAPILIMGEAPGFEEAAVGKPFVGAAGSMLERIFRRNRLNRGAFRIGNVLQCVPPGLQLEGMPYQHTAIAHCAVHRDQVLNEGHPVVIAAGGTALRTLLGLHGAERVRVEDFHGTVHDDIEGRFKVIPTFHTSYLQRGAHNLIGTVSYDFQVALEVMRGEWQPQPLDLVIDPPKAWLEAWVQLIEEAAWQDPDGVAIASDLETPDKANKPENELTPDDTSYQIIRYNFAVNGEQGVTFPDTPELRPLARRLLALRCRHYWWNGYGYDWARAEVAHPGAMEPLWQLDLMVAAHVLQSDVPLGLGFWAPFYSNFGAWKHRSLTDPAWYACVDGPQTYRVGVGIIGDLIQQGQWRVFQEDCHELYHQCLKPAQDIGLLIDRPELERFHQDLAGKQLERLQAMQPLVPESLRPLTHETQDHPGEGVLHPMARTHTLRGVEKVEAPDPIKAQLYATALPVQRELVRTIQVCQTCGAVEIHKKHRCKREDGKVDKEKVAVIALEDRLVTRWFWQEPFNPDSPLQMLAYIKSQGHKPGKDKKTRKDSADRETLVRLSKSTRDPFYQINLDYRAVKKVDSTYAVPTMRRVDAEVAAGREPRLHPIPTFRPSMGRLSYVSPNITNVVADKGSEKKNLAGGFRRCVVASPGCRLLECVAPETRILKADLTWVRADALQIDDELLAFDEQPKGHDHSFRTARVTATARLTKPRVRVTTSHGSVLVAASHPFLARNQKAARRWVQAQGLQPGMRMAFLSQPWEVDTTWAGGYLAGFFDGEGWVSKVNVGYAQNRGATLDRVNALLTAKGFQFYEPGGYNSTAQCAITNGIRDALRFLGSIRPPRLLEKSRQVWEERRTWGKQSPVCTVVSVAPAGEGPVIALETTTHTYIAEGFFSHNCDYAGIEAIEVGWYARDPAYIRLARLGVHAYLASHLLGRPASLAWSDQDLLGYFRELKASDFWTYDQAKRCVHGTNYGLTPYGMANTFPELYQDLKAAEKVQRIYFDICPSLPTWHGALRQRAYDVGYLGGPGEVLRGADNACYKPDWKGLSPWPHPFQYQHWFWAVLAYKPISEAQRLRRQKQHKPCVEMFGRWFAVDYGEDSKRVIAFYPQSTAAGVLKRSIRSLLTNPDHPDYIGDTYYGRTPFRAPIHDSLLLEVPDRAWDRVVERVVRALQRPVWEQPLPAVWGMGDYLQIGVEAKAGRNWLEVETIPTEGVRGEVEGTLFGIEELDEEDAIELRMPL